MMRFEVDNGLGAIREIYVNPRHVVWVKQETPPFVLIQTVNGYFTVKGDASEISTDLYNKGACKP